MKPDKKTSTPEIKKKSIFIKIMTLSISIVLVSTLVLGFIHYILIERYVNMARTETLMNYSERINNLTSILRANYSPSTQQFYQVNIDSIAQNIGAYIILTDGNGEIIIKSSNCSDKIYNSKMDISAFSDVMHNKNVVKTGTYNDIFGQKILTAATPLIASNEVYGILLVNSPMPRVNTETYSLFSLLLISCVASIIVAIILSYILTYQFTKPIKQLSRAAGIIARGNFEVRAVESDITELSELSEAFNTMAEDIAKHDKSRTAFIANVSHDLRTPMTTISGFLQGILDGTVPEESKNQYLKVVLNETRRLSELVSTFLDVSRYDMGDVRMNFQSIDINEIIRIILISFEKRINEKNLEIVLNFEHDSEYVYADEAAIQRVIVNIVDNAMKFINENGTFTVDVIRKNNKVQIGIENTGTEIPPDDRKFIFDRFFKTDKSRNENKNGTGLGLYIVKSILMQHDEKIWVESADNKTSFIFTLQPSKPPKPEKNHN